MSLLNHPEAQALLSDSVLTPEAVMAEPRRHVREDQDLLP
jgi:hypothetical protein